MSNVKQYSEELRPNGSPQNVAKSSFQNLHLPVFLAGFTPQCATLFEDFQKYHLGSVTSRLASLLWCGMVNIILGVYFKRSLWCSCNECVWQKRFVSLFVWSRPGVGGNLRLF